MTIEVMIVAIKRSMDALSALFFFLITGTMLFSTLLYFAERGNNNRSLLDLQENNHALRNVYIFICLLL